VGGLEFTADVSGMRIQNGFLPPCEDNRQDNHTYYERTTRETLKLFSKNDDRRKWPCPTAGTSSGAAGHAEGPEPMLIGDVTGSKYADTLSAR
jgi:hypothetical protein